MRLTPRHTLYTRSAALCALLFLCLIAGPLHAQNAAPNSATLSSFRGKAPTVKVQELGSMRHDSRHFTQGLFFSNGYLYESAGLYGESALYRLNPENGKELHALPFPEVFLEGSAALNGVIHLLTWRDGVRYRIDEESMELLLPVHEFSGEGWGLCSAGAGPEGSLWLSDGSAVLRRIQTGQDGPWTELERLRVTDAGRPVELLNELEWVEGVIFANVWMSNKIAIIDPARKAANNDCPVLLWLDCTALALRHTRLHPATRQPLDDAVLNGIAWDAQNRRLLITGKLWPKFYEIALPELPIE